MISCAHDACESHDTGRRGVPTVTNYTSNNETRGVIRPLSRRQLGKLSVVDGGGVLVVRRVGEGDLFSWLDLATETCHSTSEELEGEVGRECQR